MKHVQFQALHTAVTCVLLKPNEFTLQMLLLGQMQAKVHRCSTITHNFRLVVDHVRSHCKWCENIQQK